MLPRPTDCSPCDLPTEEQSRPVPPRFWWLKRIAAGVGIVLVSLIVLRLWWGGVANRRWQAEIDRYRAAGQPVYPEDFDPPAVRDEDNAALLLTQAAAAIVAPPGVSITVGDVVRRPQMVVEHLDQVREIIEANAAVFDLAHQARGRAGVDWGTRLRSPVLTTFLPSYRGQRQLGKLLCVGALYHHHVGNDHATVQHFLDAQAVAEALNSDPRLIGHLVATAAHAIVTMGLEAITHDLRVAGPGSNVVSVARPARRAHVESLIADLLNDRDFRESLVRVQYGERAMPVDTIELITGGQQSVVALVSWRAGRPSLAERVLNFPLTPMIQLDGLHMIRHSTAWAEAAAESTWPAVLSKAPPDGTDLSGLKALTRSLSRIFGSSSERAVYLHFRSLAEQRMAATALAMRLYELDHAHRPAKLGDLVPEYLPEIPQDPLATDGRGIGYAPNAERPILYSVGPNGVDEHGAYALHESGSIDSSAADLPFFLNGDRPRRKPSRSPNVTGSAQTGENDGNVDDEQGDAEQNQPGQTDP